MSAANKKALSAARAKLLPSRLAFAALLLTVAAGCGPPPQLGGDDETLKISDALWTAITAHDTKLVENSAATLETMHSEGKLPDPAYAYLQDCITAARDGRWDKSRERLRALIKAQRR